MGGLFLLLIALAVSVYGLAALRSALASPEFKRDLRRLREIRRHRRIARRCA